MVRHVILFFAFMVFVMPSPATAEEEALQTELAEGQIGVVIEVEGAAKLSHGNGANVTTLTQDTETPVFMNDIIETEEGAKAHILFIDDTEITIGENAYLTIDEYVFDPDNSNDNKGRFSILRGVFLFTSGMLTKNDKPDVEINIAYGSIGIRGTSLWGGVLDETEEYGILVHEGDITVTTERGRVRIGEGMGTNIRNRKSVPSRAKKWSPEKIRLTQARTSLTRKEIVKARIQKRKERRQSMPAKRKEIIKEHIKERRESIKEKGDIPPLQRQEKREERIQEFKERREMKKSDLNAPLDKNKDTVEVIQPVTEAPINEARQKRIKEAIKKRAESKGTAKDTARPVEDAILKEQRITSERKKRIEEAIKRRSSELQGLPPAKREEIIEKMHLDEKGLQDAPSTRGFE